MNILSLWQSLLRSPWVSNLVVPAVVFLVFLLLSGLVSDLVSRLAARASEKTGGPWGRWFGGGFRRPMRALMVGIGAYAALRCVPALSGGWPVLDRCFRSFLVVVLAWGLYRMASPEALARSAFLAEKIKSKGSGPLLPAISGAARFVVLALAVLIIAQEWNYSISGLLAGLGIGGLAFALAAKDMLANLFGGIVILLDKPFTLGDWVRTGEVEGTVEAINFRSVKIRTADRALVSVPNSAVVNGPVANFSRAGGRRLELAVSADPGTPVPRLKSAVEEIRLFLEQDPEIEEGTASAALEGIGDAGPRLRVSCFAKTADRMEFLQAREKVCYAVLDALNRSRSGPPLPRGPGGD